MMMLSGRERHPQPRVASWLVTIPQAATNDNGSRWSINLALCRPELTCCPCSLMPPVTCLENPCGRSPQVRADHSEVDQDPVITTQDTFHRQVPTPRPSWRTVEP
jgi:hypothetical protein